MLSPNRTPGIGIGRGRGIIKSSTKEKGPNVADKENSMRTFADTVYVQCGTEKDDYEIRPPRMKYVPNDDMEEYRLRVDSGIHFCKFEDVKVTVTGRGVLPPINSIANLEIPQFLKDNIAQLKYVSLTPVQKYAIPIIAARRDIMACAETGSGKTMAYLVPILAAIKSLNHGSLSDRNSPHCIVLVPSRELCRQVFTAAMELCRSTSIKVAYGYGGIEMHTSLSKLKSCDFLCCTPGRLMQYINSDVILLNRLSFLVLDEADMLLDVEHFMIVVRQLITGAKVLNKRQLHVSMLSATFPRQIQCLAQELLEDYLFVAVGIVGAANNDIKQTLLSVTAADKLEVTLDYIASHDLGKTLIFVKRKRLADFYGIRLIEMGLLTTTIHGDREQVDREQALNDFKSGRVSVLVATDVASRGLDIPNVDTVVNVDMPDDVDLYVHRIGRSGRCGNPGSAVTFFDVQKDYHQAPRLIQVLRGSNQIVPDFLSRLGGGLKVRDPTKGSMKDLRKAIGRTNSAANIAHSSFMNMKEDSDDEFV